MLCLDHEHHAEVADVTLKRDIQTTQAALLLYQWMEISLMLKLGGDNRYSL